MAGPHRDPREPGAGAELSPWMASQGTWGWLVGPDPGLLWVTPPRVEHQLLSPPPPPSNWGLMVIRSSVLSLFEPRGNNSYLSLWKVVDFSTLGSWVLIKKQQRKKPPTSDNVKYLKPPHCTFFRKPSKTCFLFLSRKNIIGEYLYGCTSA